MKNYNIVQLRREYVRSCNRLEYARDYLSQSNVHQATKECDAAWDALEGAIRADARIGFEQAQRDSKGA